MISAVKCNDDHGVVSTLASLGVGFDCASKVGFEPYWYIPWWRHQMETFSALLAICAGNSPVPGKFPSQRPVTQNVDVFFDLRLNNREAGDLRRYRAHYDVTVMQHCSCTYFDISFKHLYLNSVDLTSTWLGCDLYKYKTNDIQYIMFLGNEKSIAHSKGWCTVYFLLGL